MVGILVGCCRSASSLYDLDITFNHAIMTVMFKILSSPSLGNCEVKEVKIGDCRYATSWYDLDLAFYVEIVTLIMETLRCRKLKLGTEID